METIVDSENTEQQTQLDNLRDQVLSDLDFDMEEAGQHAFSLISLRERYTHLLVRAERVVKSIERERQSLHRTLFEHYLTNYDVRVDRRDIKTFIEGDKKWLELQKKFDEAKTLTKYLDGVVEAIDRHGFNVGHAIKWEIFKRGG